MVDEDDTSNEYAIEVINNERDARLCAQLTAEEFIGHNPTTFFDKLTSDILFHQRAWPLLADVVDEQLSFLARHQPSGEIVGTAIAGDLFLAHIKHPYDTDSSAHFLAIGDLCHEMNHLFISRDFGQELKPNSVLNIIATAVRGEHSGQGLASRMTRILCDHARKAKGFQYAFVQATHPAARHIYRNKMGGRQVSLIDPTIWRWKKKFDRLSYPYKDYQDDLIENILIKLILDEKSNKL
ncbi:unnamed protein product [Rotaria sp. Silwood2]|nr:unnamed protein product [Rotaria sp. Silwood2]CAF2831848.1 unnamed protein product [Rotaria sp. Silwood2]CAF3860510.1 unnamed protein product [Rotaria sp. Silwood2]CAF4081176.1 unnamed protein product [Rotaria sp. Silwood2]